MFLLAEGLAVEKLAPTEGTRRHVSFFGVRDVWRRRSIITLGAASLHK